MVERLVDPVDSKDLPISGLREEGGLEGPRKRTEGGRQDKAR